MYNISPKWYFLDEIRGVVVAVWNLGGRFMPVRGRAERRQSPHEAFARAQLALGERMYAAHIDDGRLGAQIGQLNERIRWAKAAGLPSQALETERIKLLRQLADCALEDDAPLPGADAEYLAARQAQAVLRSPDAAHQICGL